MQTLNMMRVKPAPGRKVFWPGEHRPLKPDGESVPATTYWQRRLRCGDVLPMTAQPQKKEG